MSKSNKSLNGLLSCVAIILVLGFISIGLVGGCSNNGGGQNETTSLTENDFANDSTLRADPEIHTVVKFLEHPDTEHENDTGEVGNDIIPLTYKTTQEHTYCWEDEDEDAGHFMELDDLEGNEILRLDANDDCVTGIVEAGDYILIIHHDQRIVTTHPIFIIPNPDEMQQAKNEEGLINSFIKVIWSGFKGFNAPLTKIARAQTASNLDTLITTRACVNCDLTDADLTGADLTGVDLTGADLTGAIWVGGDCACADMSVGGCVGCQPLVISRKILDLRPIKGMAYQPAPSDYGPGCGRNDFSPASCKYFDTDFANNDFKGLWSSSNPGGTGPGRGDLEIMANELNINFLHLYNWTSPQFRNHLDFLNECSSLGIRVTLPISNFTLQCVRGDQSCRDAIGGGDPVAFAKQNIKDIMSEVITNGKPHDAIAMWLIGNEYDISGFSADVVAKTIQFLLEVEMELGVVDDAYKLPISSPISFGTFGAPPDQPGIVKTKELIEAIKNNPTTAPILASRFVAALNSFNMANFMETYLEMTFPNNVPNVALWLAEYGFNSDDAGGETQQAQIVLDQLDLCESLIINPTPVINPNDYFVGCTYFEWINEEWKGGAEGTWGALKFDGTQVGTGRTVKVPTNGAEDYPIDNIVEKPVFDSIMQAFMK